MGGQLYSRSHKWYIHAIDIVSAVSTVSTLFLAKYGSVQGKIAGRIRKCGQTSVASVAHYVHKHQMFGGIINDFTANVERGQFENDIFST